MPEIHLGLFNYLSLIISRSLTTITAFPSAFAPSLPSNACHFSGRPDKEMDDLRGRGLEALKMEYYHDLH